MRIRKYLFEAKGKGYTLTCNKCGEVANIVKNNTIKPKSKIDIYVDAEEDAETGGSVGFAYFKCNKCGQEILFDE